MGTLLAGVLGAEGQDKVRVWSLQRLQSQLCEQVTLSLMKMKSPSYGHRLVEKGTVTQLCHVTQGAVT